MQQWQLQLLVNTEQVSWKHETGESYCQCLSQLIFEQHRLPDVENVEFAKSPTNDFGKNMSTPVGARLWEQACNSTLVRARL